MAFLMSIEGMEWLPDFGSGRPQVSHHCVIQRRPTFGLLPNNPQYEGEYRAVCTECTHCAGWGFLDSAQESARMHPIYFRYGTETPRQAEDPQLLMQAVVHLAHQDGHDRWVVAWYEGERRQQATIDAPAHLFAPLETIVAGVRAIQMPSCQIKIGHWTIDAGSTVSYITKLG
jgi:hypothetical protein